MNFANIKMQVFLQNYISKNLHFYVDIIIREVIEKNGGTMPENLPTPKKSLKELEKEKQEKIEMK